MHDLQATPSQKRCPPHYCVCPQTGLWVAPSLPPLEKGQTEGGRLGVLFCWSSIAKRLCSAPIFITPWQTCYMPGCVLSAQTSCSSPWCSPAMLGTQNCALVPPSCLSAPSVPGYCPDTKMHPGRGTKALSRRALHGARDPENPPP